MYPMGDRGPPQSLTYRANDRIPIPAHFSGGNHVLTPRPRIRILAGKPARLFAVFSLLLLTAFTTLGLPARAQQPKIANVPDNPYGVNVFLHKEVEAWKIEKTL